jgi:predicted pyridoxine 5'-phosphate oxidase superfamily flavin-nucleotide-binding protein
MASPTTDVAFTNSVKALQERHGSREQYAKVERRGGWRDRVTPELAAFLAERDSFYLATASADGRPYLQHRGGPTGFLKIVDDRTLAFADFDGNRQYITAGNLAENDRAFIFLMDYAAQRRIKLWGRARVVEGDPALLARLAEPGYAATPTQVVVFSIEAWDVNCRQHIVPRFDAAEVEAREAGLRARIAALEAELAALKRSGAGLANDPGRRV